MNLSTGSANIQQSHSGQSPNEALSDEKLATWQLLRTKGIGPVSFYRLIKRCGTATQALKQLPSLYKEHNRPCPQIPSVKQIQQEYQNLTNHGGKALFYTDETYPKLLAQIPTAPPMLHVLGRTDFLNDPALAMVGTRNASAHGQTFMQNLAADLSQNMFTIVSGLARGVDTAAHTGALQANGLTIAVVAGGVDHIYPPENKKLREDIIQNGCVMSEAPFGTAPQAQHFPRRNRIIAGLSRAVIVGEADRRSGSLITATYAGEFGRDVYAVPGSPADARAAGPNHLLKQGASLLENAQDILENKNLSHAWIPQTPVVYTGEDIQDNLFEPTADNTPTSTPTIADQPTQISQNLPQENTQTSLETSILSLLSPTPLALDDLIRRSPQPKQETLTTLSELELTGQLKRVPGGIIRT